MSKFETLKFGAAGAVLAVVGYGAIEVATSDNQAPVAVESNDVQGRAPTTTMLNLSPILIDAKVTYTEEGAPVAEEVTDEILLDLDRSTYNCGGSLRPADMTPGTYNANYAVQYLNQNPELAKDLGGFYKTAFGEEAAKILVNEGEDNQITSDSDIITADETINGLVQNRKVATLSNGRTFMNFTCKPEVKRAGNKPTIIVSAGQNVEGVVLGKESLEKFLKEVNTYPDGSSVADYFKIDTGDDKDEKYFVVTNAYGCDNPLLRVPEHPTKRPRVNTPYTPHTTPGTPPTTIKKTYRTTTTVPGSRPKTENTTAPRTGENGGDINGTPSTEAGNGLPDQAENPAGFVPGEYVPPELPQVIVPDNNSNTTPPTGGEQGPRTDAPAAPAQGVDQTTPQVTPTGDGSNV